MKITEENNNKEKIGTILGIVGYDKTYTYYIYIKQKGSYKYLSVIEPNKMVKCDKNGNELPNNDYVSPAWK